MKFLTAAILLALWPLNATVGQQLDWDVAAPAAVKNDDKGDQEDAAAAIKDDPHQVVADGDTVEEFDFLLQQWDYEMLIEDEEEDWEEEEEEEDELEMEILVETYEADHANEMEESAVEGETEEEKEPLVRGDTAKTVVSRKLGMSFESTRVDR